MQPKCTSCAQMAGNGHPQFFSHFLGSSLWLSTLSIQVIFQQFPLCIEKCFTTNSSKDVTWFIPKILPAALSICVSQIPLLQEYVISSSLDGWMGSLFQVACSCILKWIKNIGRIKAGQQNCRNIRPLDSLACMTLRHFVWHFWVYVSSNILHQLDACV